MKTNLTKLIEYLEGIQAERGQCTVEDVNGRVIEADELIESFRFKETDEWLDGESPGAVMFSKGMPAGEIAELYRDRQRMRIYARMSSALCRNVLARVANARQAINCTVSGRLGLKGAVTEELEEAEKVLKAHDEGMRALIDSTLTAEDYEAAERAASALEKEE